MKSQNRTGVNVEPSWHNNRRALEEGHMVLEDLIVLAPTILRLKKYGIKTRFRNCRRGLAGKKIRKSEFSLEYLQDSNIDISLTLNSSKMKHWSTCVV